MRLIDADAFKEYIRESFEEAKGEFQTEKYLKIADSVTEGFLKDIDEQPTVEAKPVEEIYKMSESDFITYTLSTICDYAKINDYDITDTVKVMGENLVALTDICTFDNWKAGADMRGGKNG